MNYFGGMQYPFQDYSQQLMKMGLLLGGALRGERREDDPSWAWNKDIGQYYDRNSREAPQVPAGYKPAAQAKPMPAGVFRQKGDAQTNANILSNSLNALKQASDLLGKDNDGLFEKGTAPLETALGTSLNVYNLPNQAEDWVNKTFGTDFNIVNPDKALRTDEFQQIMQSESLKRLSSELKGPTAVQEVLKYESVIADPRSTNAKKRYHLDRMIKAIEADIATQQRIIGNIDRVYPDSVVGGDPVQDAAPDSVDTPADEEQLRAWAQEAIDQGADPEQVRQMLREYGVE